MLFTDPRYFTWVFNMENEIRKTTPIAYLNIWDDYPAPMYNKPYYEACDLLMGISKQTVNINKLVLEGSEKNKIFKYIPHGKNTKNYFPITEQTKEFDDFKKELFGGSDPEFVVFYNSRNIRRKQIPDTIMAFRAFLDGFADIEEAKKCRLVLKTEMVTDAGTDLDKVREYILGENYLDTCIILDNKFSEQQLNYLFLKMTKF